MWWFETVSERIQETEKYYWNIILSYLSETNGMFITCVYACLWMNILALSL